MKKKKIIAATLIMVCLFPTVKLAAEGVITITNMQNLMTKYSDNSSALTSINLNYKKQKSDDYKLKKNLDEIDLKIDSNNKKSSSLIRSLQLQI